MFYRKTKVILIHSLLFFIVFPIILNFFLALPRLPTMKVVGTSTDWLLFYATYAGSIISTVCAFIILYFTIKQGNRERISHLMHNEIMEIRHELSERFSKYNIAELLILDSLKEKSDVNVKKDIMHLQMLKNKYKGLWQSAYLLYGHNELEEERLFFHYYLKLMEDSLNTIENLDKYLSKAYDSSEDKNIGNINSIINDIERLERLNQEVIQLADKYLCKLVSQYRNYSQFII